MSAPEIKEYSVVSCTGTALRKSRRKSHRLLQLLIKWPRHWLALMAAQHHRDYPASCLCLYSDRPHTVSFLCSNMIGAGYSKPNFRPRAILLRYIRYCTYQERFKTHGAQNWACGRGHGILFTDQY